MPSIRVLTKFRALITSVPFAEYNRLPLDMLAAADVVPVLNPHGRKMSESELIALIGDVDLIIAGTDPITDEVMANAPKLKFIARLGVGLDNVDLLAAERRGVKVSYTPDAPAPATAELTIGLMLSLLRGIHLSNLRMHQKNWYRPMGRRLAEITLGIIGTGRIGARVLRRISAFGTPRVLVNDIHPNPKLVPELKLEWVSKEEIFQKADLISVHLPMTQFTRNMIAREQLLQMKPNALLVNTSRGGIVNEKDLAEVMKSGHLAGAAIDVFEVEPYTGELTEVERCLLTSHIGPMSEDCRSRMEIEATEEAVKFVMGQPLASPVPPGEYQIRQLGPY